jgi:tetratricopeptide (TPR) repeat protein
MEIWAMQNKIAGLTWCWKFRRWVWSLALMMVLAVFIGCAAGGKVKEQPPATVTNLGPSVERLTDGRQGFVIREIPSMDAESRDEFERAVAMMNDGKNDTAIELLTKVIERAPGVTAPYINIAVAYMRTGKSEPAEEHLKTALGLVPGHPVASNEYGLLLRKAGRFKEARDVYEKAIAGFPDYLPVHRNLGILCDLYMSDPECALKQFEIYSAGMPADAQVKIWIAELRMRLKR